MSEITQLITDYGGDIPDKASMSADEFDVAAEDWVDYQDGLSTELNELSAQINIVADEINTNAESVLDASLLAIAAANFKGNWDDLTGALDVPASVYHNGRFWILLIDLADVTASEPSLTNTDWACIYVASSTIINKTANYTISAIDMLGGFVIITNLGATGGIVLTLPTRLGDYRIGIMVKAEQYIRVNPPSGEALYYVGGASSAVNGYIRSNSPGTFFEIIGSTTMGYTVVNLQGTIKVDE